MSTLLVLMVLSSLNFAQAQSVEPPLDGVYKKIHVANAKTIPYAHLREADVMYCKRIWRTVDFREKINLPFTSPNHDLYSTLLNAVTNGELTAYRADEAGEEFKSPLTPEEVAGIGTTQKTIYKNATTGDIYLTEEDIPEGTDPNDIDTSTTSIPLNPESVKMLRVKEDWFFDKQRSVWEARIVGICPVYIDDTRGGAPVPMFWIYFPEARKVLATTESVNRFNDGARLSFDDVFVKRMFNSYIYKESNERDVTISEYAQGMDALMESERIKTYLFNYEHDLWEY